MTKFEKFKNQNSAYCVFNFLVKTKEEVTKEEYDFIIAYDEREKDHFSYIGDYNKNYDYLNLNVYSEHDHEKRQYEMEIG
tara:strand:- start:123 stop:362 length:240 start_codon:yes stop_codon:yes gene_type:complete